MRILMTGSTGFVGKCLVKMLNGSSYEIWHLVRNRKGFKNEFVWDFVNSLPEEVPPCDIVVHLAAHADFSQDIEILQYNVNTVSTMKLAAYAKFHNAYFVFASMVGVHGTQFSTIDDSTPINPPNHYAMSKYLSEEVIKSYVDNYHILRICGIYGLDGPEHLGLNRAISNAIHNKVAPVLKGPGKAKRNYICVYDVAQLILFLVKKHESILNVGEASVREMLYLAGPEIMSIENYLELIVETILPGMELGRIDGPESQDLIVKASSVPFPQITFRQYLRFLCSPT